MMRQTPLLCGSARAVITMLCSKYHLFLVSLLIVVHQVYCQNPVAEQLINYKKNHPKPPTLKTGFGTPVDDETSILTVGHRGPGLVQDIVTLDQLSRFVRERIPSRVLCTRGAGAFGVFEVTNDISKYTKAHLFNKVGKKTRVAARFSIVLSRTGTPDTTRGLRAIALKFYTEQGTWDLLGFHITSIFSDKALRYLYIDRRDPATNLQDVNIFWDMLLHNPHSLAQALRLFGEEGLPDGYRYINGHAINTFKLVNADGKVTYCKFHWLSEQGTKYLSPETAASLISTTSDYATRDLYNAIGRKKFPSWTLYIQVMDVTKVEKYPYNPFDPYREWPEKQFPLIEVGKITLTENPKNYFQQIEQLAFSPAHMVPGIEPSFDRLLQERLLLYTLAHQHRLGANYLQIKVNRPFKDGVHTYSRDGIGVIFNGDDSPNYYPNSYNGPEPDPSAAIKVFSVSTDVRRYNETWSDYAELAASTWNSMSDKNKLYVAREFAQSLSKAVYDIQKRVLKLVQIAVPELAKIVRQSFH